MSYQILMGLTVAVSNLEICLNAIKLLHSFFRANRNIIIISLVNNNVHSLQKDYNVLEGRFGIGEYTPGF